MRQRFGAVVGDRCGTLVLAIRPDQEIKLPG